MSVISLAGKPQQQILSTTALQFTSTVYSLLALHGVMWLSVSPNAKAKPMLSPKYFITLCTVEASSAVGSGTRQDTGRTEELAQHTAPAHALQCGYTPIEPP